MPQANTPNIVYIDCHDLGDWLSCFGRTHLTTPNLDRLAAEGASFHRYFATAPICMPSRAGIYTGQMPHTVDVHGQFPVRSGTSCMAKLLADHGYETILVGNTKLRNTPDELGFHTHLTPSADDSLEDAAAKWISSQATISSQPYFVSVSFDDVHRPFGNEFDAALAEQLTVPPYLPDIPLVRADLATLHRVIERLDTKVGQILDAVKQSGREDDTIVIFTTEHGPAIGRAKHTLYDSGLKTALLIKYPRQIEAGCAYHELLSNLDLLPTLLELVGAQVPDNLHGRSFHNLLTGESFEERRAVFAEHSWGRRAGLYHYTPIRAVRTTRYKLMRNFSDRPPYIDTDWLARFGDQRQLPEKLFGRNAPDEELYDLDNDPGELSNVAAELRYASVLEDLRELLTANLKRTSDPILAGDIPHPEGLPNVPLWERQPDGSFQLRAYRREESSEEPI